MCRKAVEACDEKLRQQSVVQLQKSQAERQQKAESSSAPSLFCPSVAADEGVTPQPSLQHNKRLSLQVINWAVPAYDLAYKVLQATPESFHDNLGALWRDQNVVHSAAACPQHILPTARANNKCDVVGMCLCLRWRLREFVKKLIAMAKTSFPANTTARRQLGKGMVIMRLWSPGKGEVWLHLGYMNLKTWMGALLPLQRSSSQLRQIRAEVAGCIALELAQPSEKRLGVGHWWHHCDLLTLTQPWIYQLYLLRDDEHATRMHFVPNDVEVRAFFPHASFEFWTGDEQKPSKKRKPKEDTPFEKLGPQPRKSGRPKSKSKASAKSAASAAPKDKKHDPSPLASSGSERENDSSAGDGSGFASDASWMVDVEKGLESAADTAFSQACIV